MSKRKITASTIESIINLVSDEEYENPPTKRTQPQSISDSDSDDDYVEIVSNPFSTPIIRLPKDIELRDLLNPEKGYVVIPYPTRIRDQFNINEFLLNQKEFLKQDPNQLFVLGGFGALGNPSSFHHPLKRQLMINVYNHIQPKFKDLFEFFEDHTDYKYFSMIPDRFCIRRNDQEVSAETWHKDQSLTKEMSGNTIVFGGWINLDTAITQKFTCAENELIMPKETRAYYENNTSSGYTPQQSERLNEKRKTVEIPPGHMLLFNELLTHEVTKSKSKSKFDPSKTSYRCFIKFIIRTIPEPYWSPVRMENFFNRQTQIGMSTYQADAPMYASAHSSTAIDKNIEFSAQLLPRFRTRELHSKKYGDVLVIDRYLGRGNTSKNDNQPRQGLTDWGLAFSPYTKEQKQIYIPSQLF